MKHYHYTDKEYILRLNIPANDYEEVSKWLQINAKGIKPNELFLIGISTTWEEYKKYSTLKYEAQNENR